MSYCYMKENLVSPQYLQFPEFLLAISISQTAKIIYMVLYDRARLSQKNKWIDNENHIFIFFPIDEICRKIGKTKTTVKRALNELSGIGLIVRKRKGYSMPNYIYVRLPVVDAACNPMQKQTLTGIKNGPSDGRKIGSHRVTFQSPNKVIETNNNKQSNRNTACRSYSNNLSKLSMPDYSCAEGESL